jgi:predicted dehydrogenase
MAGPSARPASSTRRGWVAGSPRVKIGIIGCGAIAQVQHLPHLRELPDEFEIAGLCDLSAALLQRLGTDYGVAAERCYTDYRGLLASDVEAVIVCPSGSHAPASIAAAEAGKHVFVEKPMCTTVREAEAMVAAADAAGVVLQVGYMKRHEPAYIFARQRVREMADVRFIQVNHLHPDNGLHLEEFTIHRFDDVPAGAAEAVQQEQRQLVAEALGRTDVPNEAYRAFNIILGSLIHDLGNLHGCFGPPERVVSTDIWAGGEAITTVLQYANDPRAVVSWVDLPELQDFRETLEVYGSRDRVLVSFPTGFSRGLPTSVTLKGIDSAGLAWTKQYAWHDNPFKLEIRRFRDSILHGTPTLTPGREAVADIGLVRDIVLTYLNR